MGRLSLLLVLALAVTFGIHSWTVSRRATSAVENYLGYNAKVTARNINNSTVQLALEQLADSSTWRKGYTNLSLLGGKSTLTVRDTIVTGKKAISIQCKSISGTDTVSSIVVTGSRLMPPVVHAAVTAFGPLDKTISDMYIEGEDHTDVIVSAGPPAIYQAVPNSGYYGVSTGAPFFVNSQRGLIGGTDRTVSPWVDIAPAFPNSPKVIETSSSWPNGFPTTPDAAMGWPEGTLKGIALSGADGSRYLRTEAQLDSLVKKNLPLQGVTYIDVDPSDPVWEYEHHNLLPDNSGGIFIFHCDTKTAYWDRLEFKTSTQTFKGLMIFDKLFHIHINILGALVILTPNTVTDEECPLNNDKTIALSSSIIEQYTGKLVPKLTGGWQSKLILRSWYEE